MKEHKGWELKKSDIWAIGVIAYEMYCGQRCFDGKSQKEVFSKILNANWRWPKHRRPSCKMRDFVEKCLEVDTKERLSASEALGHDWFIDGREQEPEEEIEMKMQVENGDVYDAKYYLISE